MGNFLNLNSPPVVDEGQVHKTWVFTQNPDGSLSPALSGGISSNPSVGAVGVAAPVSATEIGMVDALGKLQSISLSNPLPIVGSISATNPSVGLTGIVAPTSATEIGVIDGTGKLQGASATNPVRVDPTGSTTQPVSGTVNVGNSPTVSLTAATAVELLDSAGTNKASISAAGAVKVDGSAATQPVSGTVAVTQSTSPWVSSDSHFPSAVALSDALANPTTTEIGANLLGWDATNSVWRRVQVDAGTGTLKVDGSSVTQPVSINGVLTTNGQQTSQSNATWNNTTAQDTFLFTNITGFGTSWCQFDVTGSITGGTVVFEGADGAGGTWKKLLVTRLSTGQAVSSYSLSSGDESFQCQTAGFVDFRVRLSSVITGTGSVTFGIVGSSSTSSGPVAVTGTFFQATQPVSIAAAIDVSDRAARLLGHVTVDNATLAVTESGAWNVNQAIGVAGFGKVTDGTNTAAVKAASTAAVATDPSLVVALSPNSPVPTGANTIGSVKVTDGTTVAGVIAGTTALKTDLSSVAGTATSTAAAGVQKVGIVGGAGTSLETTAGVLDENIKNVGNAAVATAASGVQKVGIVGNTGATVDSTAAAGAAPTNAVLGSHVFNTTVPAPTAGQAVAQQCDSTGSRLVSAEGRKASYNVSYRLVDATAGQLSLTFTFAANTNKQLATIYHLATSTKTVKIHYISLWASLGAAGTYNFEVRALSAAAAPATGNPAITPGKFAQADAAAEATCLALPTTAGSLVAADSPVSQACEWLAAAGAGATNPSGLSGQEVILFDDDLPGVKPLVMRSGTAEGYAINGRCTAAVALRFTVKIVFTEE